MYVFKKVISRQVFTHLLYNLNNDVIYNNIKLFLKALLEEKQKQEDIEKMKETVSQIVQDASLRTRTAVRSFNYI